MVTKETEHLTVESDVQESERANSHWRALICDSILERTIKAIESWNTTGFGLLRSNHVGSHPVSPTKQSVWAELIAEEWILQEQRLREFVTKVATSQDAVQTFQQTLYTDLARLLLPHIDDSEFMLKVVRRALELVKANSRYLPEVDLHPENPSDLWLFSH